MASDDLQAVRARVATTEWSDHAIPDLERLVFRASGGARASLKKAAAERLVPLLRPVPWSEAFFDLACAQCDAACFTFGAQWHEELIMRGMRAGAWSRVLVLCNKFMADFTFRSYEQGERVWYAGVRAVAMATLSMDGADAALATVLASHADMTPQQQYTLGTWMQPVPAFASQTLALYQRILPRLTNVEDMQDCQRRIQQLVGRRRPREPEPEVKQDVKQDGKADEKQDVKADEKQDVKEPPRKRARDEATEALRAATNELIAAKHALRCIVCTEAERAIRFACGHVCCCKECAARLTECPICRAVSTPTLPVHL
jgi:hypothetical protein